MAFSDFTFKRLKQKYGIEENSITRLFKGIALPKFEVSERLKLDIEEGKEMPVTTEKAKSENIIPPTMSMLLRNIKKKALQN